MDLLNKMATFVRVVESGSFAAAAKQLRISSPAVSRQIATLEDDLRVTLLTRSTRKMALTIVGRRYYERCLRILRDVDDAQTVGQAGDVEGLLKVSAPITFGLERIAPHMSSLMKKHPGLLVELQLDDRLIDLAPEGVDVAIRVGTPPPETTELVAHRLESYERLVVAAPSYLKKHGAPKNPEALVKHDALMHLMGPTDTWTLLDGQREARVRPKVVFRSNALHPLLLLAVQGAGVTLLAEFLVRSGLVSGALRDVLPAWRSPPVVVNAIHRKEQPGALRIRAFVDHLRGVYADRKELSVVDAGLPQWRERAQRAGRPS